MVETAELLANSQQACDAQCACEMPCQCLGSYDVEITLKTRLAGKKLKNIPIAIVGKTEQPTVSAATELTFPTENTLAQGVIGTDGKFEANDLKAEYLEVWAKYENSGEKLRREVIKLTLGRLTPTCAALESMGSGNKVINQIWKVQDVKDEAHDKNFNDERDIIIKPTEEAQAEAADGPVTKCFIENTGRTAANSTEIFDTEIVATYTKSAEKDARLKLKITLVVDTFSLQVPYVSQNMGSVVLFVYPGTLANTPPPGSVLYGFPTQKAASIVQGTSEPTPTSQKTLEGNGWIIDESERDYVYEQVKNSLPPKIRYQLDLLSFIPNNEYTDRADKMSIRGLLGCNILPATNPMPPPHAHSPKCTEIYKPHLRAGSDLCAPTSAVMLMLYHGYQTDSIPRLRSELMRKAYEVATNNFANWGEATFYVINSPTKPWQNPPDINSAMTEIMSSQAHSRDCRGSDVLDSTGGYMGLLRRGLPSTTSVSSHVMVIRGAVVDKTGKPAWTICNDPQGNLAGPDSNYADSTKGGYKITGENEINLYGAGNDESRTKGKHVYYKPDVTYRKSGVFVSFENRFYLEKTNSAIDDKMVPGA